MRDSLVAAVIADAPAETDTREFVASSAPVGTRGRRVKRAAGMRASKPMLQVRHLDLLYGSVQILFDISFDVDAGTTLAVLGTNGAGKSTLLRAISGLSPIERGEVRIDGESLNLRSTEERVECGIVQVRGGEYFSGLSVEDSLRTVLVARPELYEQVQIRMERVYDAFPALTHRRKHDVALLSGGEQQMVALGRALMLDPKVLMIDELSLGLAPVVIEKLLGLVEQLQAAGVTLLIVEQSLNIAAAISEQVIFLEKGRVRFSGPTSELAARDDLARAVFLGGGGG